ncbi:MAG: hypothetical protein K2H64_04400 [Desulfovibrio sp.]|nr:hypothetical protein [Desulfovibrio sp.]
MFELMAFMILFFVGMAAAIWCLIIKIENVARQASEERAQLRVLLRAMESRLEPPRPGGEAIPDPDDRGENVARPEFDPLLRLSFETQPAPERDLARRELELNLDLYPKN